MDSFRAAAAPLGCTLTPGEQARGRERFWLVVAPVVRELASIHARRLRGITDQDLDDIASTKTLSLLLRAERGTWSVLSATPPQVGLFISRVARNGVLDLRDERCRQRALDADGLPDHIIADGLDPAVTEPWARLWARRVLVEAVAALPKRARIIWLLRIMRGHSSREIAAIASLALTPSHADMMLSRARSAVRATLALRGVSTQDFGCGAFLALERRFGRELEALLSPGSDNLSP